LQLGVGHGRPTSVAKSCVLIKHCLLGHAVDVECAIAGDELFLLQCRPITTLG
jgi:hypothetical protein